MSEPTLDGPDPLQRNNAKRCPSCDSVVSEGDERCFMCGNALEVTANFEEEAKETLQEAQHTEAVPQAERPPAIVESLMRERQSRVVFWFTAACAVLILVIGALVLRFRDPVVTVALMPTATPLPPTPTFTSTWTPLSTEISPPIRTPTITTTPTPTDTPRPARFHIVNPGETLIGLSLRYRVSVESIASANGLEPEAQIQVEQNLEIPWPTPTPPLVPVAVTVRGVNIVADPQGCDRAENLHEVRGGDTLLKIAAQHDVDLELLLLVNRMTADTILRPDDTLCIPEIIIGGTLPPTPGPTPTPSPTSPPAGPQLLFPIENAVIDPPDTIVTLQWAAVKNLTLSERYMVELVDLDKPDSLPRRGFTRDTSFQLPNSWRPTEPEIHQLRWRVSIVQITGTRSDGGYIYTYGGESSAEALFFWLGAVPTATPSTVPDLLPQP